jgi:prepilin-type N-terminal cleavage/methylation domain-containing protein
MSNFKEQGFTLIEVLIALVVAVVGILAMIQLSGVFLKTISESEQRTVAYAIAERQMENLRGFDNLSGSTAGESYFEDLSSSSAVMTVSSGQASYTFNVAWTITDNIVSGGVVSPGASGAIYRTLKQADIVVSWTQPDAGSVSLSSFIGGIDPNAGALTADNASNLGGDSPDVGYTPGVAPEVIAVDVADGKLKETTKPLPEVSNKSQSTQVRFETITYTNTDTELQLIQEDFLTVNCRCVLDTSGKNVVTPAYQKFEDSSTPLTEVLGATVSGATGTPASIGGGKSQSDFCTRCCANHHDTSGSSIKYSPHAGTASTGDMSFSHGIDHPHYKIVDDTSDPITLTEAVHGDEYLEACRFKRIYGVYRLIPDWDLREINVFPSTYLASVASSGLPDYVEYIKDYVKYQIYNVDLAASSAGDVKAATTAPTLTTSPSLTLSTSEDDESISRAIYMDEITNVEGLADYLLNLSAASVAEDTWLEFIPFNEINTTQLSLWASNSSAIATVTNQTIDSVYNRGLIDAQATGLTSIVASMAQGNTGILGNTYNAENDYPSWWNHITDIASGGRNWIPGTYNPMPVTVSGSSPSGVPYTAVISGDITFYGGDNLGSPTCGSSSGHGASLIITSTGSSGSEYYYSYTCTIGPVNSGDLYEAVISMSLNGTKRFCPGGFSTFQTYPFGPTNVVSYTGYDFSVGKRDSDCP